MTRLDQRHQEDVALGGGGRDQRAGDHKGQRQTMRFNHNSFPGDDRAAAAHPNSGPTKA